MQNADKQARRDAEEYAKAFMSYGEGAGVRRKLINGTIDYKRETVPGYAAAFQRHAEQQNMAAYAKKAQQNARRKDVNQAITRNAKALATGKYENLSTGLLITGAVALVLHNTGYDKKIYHAAKLKVENAKRRFKKQKPVVVYNITNS